MKSIWMDNCKQTPFPPLFGTIETEVAVVGGGMAGILTAVYLFERGKRVIVLDRDCVGHGQTGNTTAKITSQHGIIYEDLIQHFGVEKARMYADANQRAIESYRQMIERYHIACDFTQTQAYVYACAHEQVLQREVWAACALGLPASFVPRVDLPLLTCGAVRFDGQAQFHPLKFLHAASELLTVYERTPVERVEENCLYTPRGEVHAEHIVFATHYPFVNFPGMYFARMHQERAYVIALENATRPDGMYYGYEDYTFSMRSYQDKVFLGGGVHRAGQNLPGDKYQQLREAAQVLFPGSREVAHWSAQDCLTASGVPYIGHFSPKHPNWYIATGFRKWGMSSAMAAAEIITALICDGAHHDGAIFDPCNLRQQSAAKIAKEGAHAVRGLSRRVLHDAAPAAQEFAVGSGGIAEVEGRQMGVYRAAENLYYAVDLTCPHLGCRLQWNADEKSWDCPCHGSRFDFTGKRLTEPAQTNLDTCYMRHPLQSNGVEKTDGS